MIGTIGLIVYMLIILPLWVVGVAWCGYCLRAKINKWRIYK